jgi:hypothetical protein
VRPRNAWKYGATERNQVTKLESGFGGIGFFTSCRRAF